MSPPASRAETMQWRGLERARLVAIRRAIPAPERHRHAEAIAGHLMAYLGPVTGKVISFYWPIRAEPNLLPLMRALDQAGNRCALPMVVAPGTPLLFRTWRDGEPLTPGVWNIPVPVGGEEVVPDVAIAPVIGFDPACYRLGYGGGFYDRTLAALPARAIGVGYAAAAIPTIRPLPHDIPMEAVVTETGVTVCRRS